MRFRMSERLPAHLDRPLQRRMLGYVAIIGVILIAFQIFRGDRPAPGPDRPNPDALDFSVAQDDAGPPLEPDEFRATEQPSAPLSSSEDSPADPQLDPALLERIRDNTLGIRHYEAEAFYAMLDHVRRIPPALVEQAALRDVLYVNLMTDPNKYRGKLVNVVGEMWRCYELPVGPNRYGFERLYEAWVFTGDSGTHPYRIVATQLGDGVRLGENQRTPVRLTGYFLKREGYETPGGLHVAPTILAKRITFHRLAQSAPPRDDLAPVMLGVVVAFGLILAVTLVAFAWSDRHAPPKRTLPPTLGPQVTASLEALEVRNVDQMLRELSERDRFGESPTPPLPQASSNGHRGRGEGGNLLDLPSQPRHEDG